MGQVPRTSNELRRFVIGLEAELRGLAFHSESVLAFRDVASVRKAHEVARALRMLELELSMACPSSAADTEIVLRSNHFVRETMSILASLPARPPSPDALRARATSFDDPDETTRPGQGREVRRKTD